MKILPGWLVTAALLHLASGCGGPLAAIPTGTVTPAPTAVAPTAVAPTAVAPTAVELAPDFTLATLAGGELTLSSLRGRWVLVNFWATWCVPCRAEMPYLSELAQTEGDTLTVLAVNMREEPETVAAFATELGIDLPILLDPDDATLLAYGVRGLPMSFLIAPDGALVRRIPGQVQPGDVTLPPAPNP